MAWGYGTTVEDTEVYEGQPDDPGLTVDVMNEGQITQDPIPETYRHHTPGVTGGVQGLFDHFSQSGLKEEPYVSASGGSTLNEKRLSDKVSFYLDDTEFGVRYADNPLSAHLGFRQGGQANWGAQVGGGTGLLNANVGIAGQGTSGQISPWGNLSTEPIPGLTFSVGAQKNPGMNFNMTGPSLNYQQQFKTPIGPLDLNLDKSYGGDWTGMLRYQKDW